MLLSLSTGLALGFAGSLHCVGMCGPLVLALPQQQNQSALKAIWVNLSYHLSRSWAYMLMGLVVGMLGKHLQSFMPKNFPAILSIFCGLFLLLITFYLPSQTSILPVFIRGFMHKLSKDPSFGSTLILGFLNAFLPCGMVYVALAMAINLSSPINAMIFMFSFGIGTLPALLMIQLGRSKFQNRLFFQKVKPTLVIACSFILIIRGLGVSLPFMENCHSIEKNLGSECHQCVEMESLKN